MPGEYPLKRAVAIIPARGGSRRLTRKNMRTLFGKPLVAWVIEAAKAAENVSDIYVTTEDEAIAGVARDMGVKVINRPAELAADNVWTQPVLQHAVAELDKQGVKFDTVVRLQGNSPQVEAEKIDEAVQKLWNKKLWEVFSVNEEGLEDAAIHVLDRECVDQEALSVYKGIVATNYRDVHTIEDLHALEDEKLDKIERDSLDFLKQLEQMYAWRSPLGMWRSWQGRPAMQTWVWQMKIPLRNRWIAMKEQNQQWKALLDGSDCWSKAPDMAVLDIGCGFGMYWPVLKEYGFKKFVGVDLFDRGRKNEHYFAAAEAYVKQFCPGCETQVIMDDVRNLKRHKLLADKFDVLMNVATTSTKLSATGVDRGLYDSVKQEFGTEQAVDVYTEAVPKPEKVYA